MKEPIPEGYVSAYYCANCGDIVIRYWVKFFKYNNIAFPVDEACKYDLDKRRRKDKNYNPDFIIDEK